VSTPPPAGNPIVLAAIADAVAASPEQAITFAEYMAICLDHPTGGYYRQPARRPGRSGDFLTAPEAHPFFGITLANHVIDAWQRLGTPASFTIREYGSGSGVLAWDILAGITDRAPDLAAVLSYDLIEGNSHRQREADAAFADAGLGDIVTTHHPATALPPMTGIVLANELADALPTHRLRWTGDIFEEAWVTFADGNPHEVFAPVSAAVAATDPAGYLARHGVRLPPGARIEWSPAAAAWMRTVTAGLDRGYVTVIDYGYPVATLWRDHRLDGTVRAHHAHTVSDNPFAAPGEEDLTAHVDFTLLQEAGESAGLTLAGFTTQGAMLASLGLGDHLVRLGQDPATTAEEYYAAQASTMRLIDPGGMGRFGVLLMAKNAPVDPPLAALAVTL